MEHRVVAGLSYFLAAAGFLVGLFVAEALYPGYHVGSNPVSDLGATCRDGGGCVVLQPAATVFGGLMIGMGFLIVFGTLIARRELGSRALPPLLLILGSAAVGVGFFNETWGVHGLLALAAFTAGPIAALVAYRSLPTPLRHLSLGLGALSLVGLAWQLLGTYGGGALFGALGDGGVERLIVYPEILWLLLFGVALMTPVVSAPLPAPTPSRRAQAPS